MDAATKAQRDANAERMSNKCRCGDGKAEGKAFCRVCFYSLAPALRARLTAREPGDGYELAFAQALRVLVASGRVTP